MHIFKPINSDMTSLLEFLHETLQSRHPYSRWASPDINSRSECDYADTG
jgi:hypothetical protein